MTEAANKNSANNDEVWSYERAGLKARVKKSDDGWAALIGMNRPIGAGFTKIFPSREEAIHFVTEYFREKFGK